MKKQTLLIVILAGLIIAFVGSMIVPVVVQAQFNITALSDEQKASLKEHVFAGLPSEENIKIRNGYVLSYNPQTRTPNWVAYHIVPDYRKTPKRKGKFATFRNDPDLTIEAKNKEYNGLFKSRGYARGHLAPFAAMGGDRNKNSKYAEYHKDNTSNIGDEEDAKTIFEANYMSNIAPQHHTGFNGWLDAGGERTYGLWYELERWIQDDLVEEQETEVWIFAGCIFGKGKHEKVGPSADITVPPMFYKIVIMEDPESDIPIVLAYLFPHQRTRHGELDHFLVSIDVIEALANVDFFSELDDDKEDWLEDQDTWNFAQLHFTFE